MNQCASWYFIHILFFALFCTAILPQEKNDTLSSIVALSHGTIHNNAIEKLIAQPIRLERVTCDADVYFQKDEFVYLTNLVAGEMIDAPQVIRGLEYLRKKNKFSVVKIYATISQEAITLHYCVTSFWTFKKVKTHGVFQKKTMFNQCYLMSRGDVFSQSKHDYSIMKIKEILEQDGYFSSQVKSRFEYDKKTKEVIVHITIQKGRRFVCGNSVVEITGDEEGSAYHDLQQQITQRLLDKLFCQRYKKESINREATALKTYLGHKGFVQTALSLQEHKNKKKCIVDLLWKITVHQKRTFVFFGNHFFSQKELLDKIMTFGRSAWLMPATLFAEEIVTAYKHKGFWNAQVTGQEEKGRSFFVIQEGARAVIKAVEMRNVSLLDPNLLKRRCFRKISQNKYYDFQLYNQAVKMLAHVYESMGFLSAAVIDHTFVPLEKENEYKLVVTIDEGMQSYITSVVVEEYPEIQKEGPFKRDFEHDPALFDVKIIDQQRSWLMNYFQKNGYLYPRVKAQVDTHGTEIHIVWSVDPGEKVFFGKTIITGSTTFPFKQLMKLMCYEQADKWDQEKIKRTFKSLKELDIFESINLIPDISDKRQEKPVIVKIHSDDTYEIRARAGLELQHVQKYQTFNGLTYKIGGTGLVRNPFNRGDVARLDLDFARSHREVVARYQRPIFLNIPAMWNVQVYSISYDQQGFIGSVNDIYTLQQNGFSCGIERKTTVFEYSLTAGCEGMLTKIKDPTLQKSLIKAIDFQPQLVGQMVPFFFVEPTIMFEGLDNPLNPRSGLLTLFSLKGMIPFKKKYQETLFVKLLFEQSFFIPLHSVVAAFRFRFGHIFYRKLSAIMPSERFYLGGSHSLRGYEADLAPPLGVFVDEETNEHIVPRGGKSMLNINAELRFPIFKKVGGVIFQDFGILNGDTFDDFKPQNFLASTGFGGRFYTPLGPLRFDIGWRWRKQTPLERSYAWFLTFGHAF